MKSKRSVCDSYLVTSGTLAVALFVSREGETNETSETGFCDKVL